MIKCFLLSGAFFSLLAVTLGAMGAHALKARFAEGMQDVFEKAVLYQFIHALGLLVLGLLAFHIKDQAFLKYSGYAFVVGIVLFSGSLYIYSLTGRDLISFIVHITPFGGLAMMAAWVLMMLGIYKGL
jgi:uncharacterized membrane protein YgdD (TMEM256/DUF423 family)